MEVHHHSHTARKKWTHYIWEFLMLFLAVFAGFIAENIREHTVEHRRAADLAELLYNDILTDTANINAVLQYSTKKLAHIDSLTGDLHHEPGSWNDTSLTRHIFWLVRFQAFERSRSTFDQLKSSGSLRYFNRELVKQLNAYDVTAQEIKLREDAENTILGQRVVPLSMQTINFEWVYAFSFNDTVNKKVYVKIRDRDKAEYFINEAAGIKILANRLKNQYEKLWIQAGEIIRYLRKRYHLN